MDLGVKDKVYFLAASSRGLGRAVAEELHESGASVFLGGRSEDTLFRTLKEMGADQDATVRGAVLDCSSAESIESWIEEGMHTFSRMDGLLINAGGPPAGKFKDFDDSDFDAAYQLTLMSAVRLVRESLPALRGSRGSILMLTSQSVREPVDNLILSNVFRSGVNALMKSLSRELAADGIRTNCIAPGLIDTDRLAAIEKSNAEATGRNPNEVRKDMQSGIPMGRYGDPREFGKMGAFLLSPAASYVNGESVQVDGGLSRSV
ncbi:MAG: SDR family oxidoreductase [Leptospiraceae bacterium]|nr:SDR family oxidoreductase [Leptospiraceae bacterium]